MRNENRRQEGGKKRSERQKSVETISDALELLEDTMLTEAMQKRQAAEKEGQRENAVKQSRQEQRTGAKAEEEKDSRKRERGKGKGKKEKGEYRKGRKGWKAWQVYGGMAACVTLLVAALRFAPAVWSSRQDTPRDSATGTTPEQGTSSDSVPGTTPEQGTSSGSVAGTTPEQGTSSDSVPEMIPEQESSQDTTPPEQTEAGAGESESQEAYGFTMGNDIVYFPISFDERRRFGLVKSDAIGLTPENTYQITEEDLGEVMGSVQESADAGLIGCTVYHFAAFPDLDAICILEREGSYSFYTADGIWLPEEPGQSFERVITAYGMPESVVKLEVEDLEGNPLFTITDQADVTALCTMLSGKTDIGMQANNERYARLWKDTYGNEEVSYDGESFFYSDQVDYDAVHAFWHAKQRVIWVTTERGFRFLMQYNPAVRTMECYGYYDLTEEEVAELNVIFGVDGASYP